MTDGRRVTEVTYLARDPRCKGLCGGDRGAMDSPARPGHTPDGRKVYWCPCCNSALRPENALDYQGKPPNLRPELTGKHRRLYDDICQYELVVLKEVRAE